MCAGFYGLFFEFLHEELRYNGAQGNSFNLFIEYLVPLKVAGGQAMTEKNCNVFWEDVLDIFFTLVKSEMTSKLTKMSLGSILGKH